MATLRQRSRDSYVIITDAGRDQSGKRQQRWVTIRRLAGERDKAFKEHAETELAKLTLNKANGIGVPTERISVSEFAERWLRDHVRPNLSVPTTRGYETLLRVHVLPSIGTAPSHEA